MKLPLVPLHLQQAVEARVRECARLYLAAGILLPELTLKYDIKGTSAGIAYPEENLIRLNPVLLIEQPAHLLKGTTGHEVAHIAAYVKHGRDIDPHGKEWRRMMRIIGQPPEVGHTLSVDTVLAMKGAQPYHCACRTHLLTPRRIAKLKKGTRYTCQTCNFALRPGPLPPGRPPQRPEPEVPAKSAPANAALPGAIRPPSEAMLAYAADLARKSKSNLPAAAWRDHLECARFIDAHRALSGDAGTSAPPTAAGGGPIAPTEKQLAYARAISLRKRIALPDSVLVNRTALSRWIGEHAFG